MKRLALVVAVIALAACNNDRTEDQTVDTGAPAVAPAPMDTMQMDTTRDTTRADTTRP